MLSVPHIQKLLSQLLDVALSNKQLLTSHTANFFIDELFVRHIPLETRLILQKLNKDEVMLLPVNVNNGDCNVDLLNGLKIRNTFPSLVTQYKDYLQTTCDKAQMSGKKFHEVLVLGEFLKQKLPTASNIVDLGSGKGYLSDFLTQVQGFNVVGVETCQSFNDSAAKRNLKISRLWKNLGLSKEPLELGTSRFNSNADQREKSSEVKRNKELEEKLRNNFNSSLIARSYKIKTDFITSATDLSEIFPEQTFSLVGLHTCGDLAANSLRLFVNSDKCTFICNVGCCYNTLTEQEEKAGFPLSSFLRSLLVDKFGPMKSLACLSPEKQMDGNAKNPLDKLFNRALLQKLVYVKTGLRLNHLQQFSKSKAAKSFLEY